MQFSPRSCHTGPALYPLEDVEGFAPPVYMSFAYLLDFHCRFKSKSSIREGI